MLSDNLVQSSPDVQRIWLSAHRVLSPAWASTKKTSILCDSKLCMTQGEHRSGRAWSKCKKWALFSVRHSAIDSSTAAVCMQSLVVVVSSGTEAGALCSPLP